jgi:uncharacterized membrane protein
MSVARGLILYGATLGVFFGIDLIWLAIMNKRFYAVQLNGLMSDKVQWVPAIIFYLLFIAALIILVVLPGAEAGSWLKACALGGLLGMVAYATYDLTNLSTIKNWPLAVTVVDIIWGTTISAIVATVSYFIAGALK